MISDRIEALLDGAASIRGAYTRYARLDRILQSVETLITRKNGKSEGAVHALVGFTRSGKSHFLQSLLASHPIEKKGIVSGNGDFADRIPVVYVKFTRSNVKSLNEAIYKAITNHKASDILGARYKEEDVFDEIVRHRRLCGIKLLVLDEAHQSILGRTAHATTEVAKLVKDLSNNLFSVLVVGTEEVHRLVGADPELQSRVHKIHELLPFQRTRDDLQVWTEILDHIDGLLEKRVFGVPSGLGRPDMAEALMTAALGLVGHMATLVENAAMEAIHEWEHDRRASADEGTGQRGIEWRHLDSAFSEWAPGRGRDNPFDERARPAMGGSPMIAVDGAMEPARQSGVRGRNPKKVKDAEFKA